MELNKIYNTDCLDLMRGGWLDNSVDLVLTDPPYKFEWHGRWMAGHRKYLKEWMTTIWTNLNTEIYTDEFMDMLMKITKAPNMIFFCNKAQVPEILEQAKKNWLNFDILVLCKTAPTPLCNNQWLPDRERAIHLFKNAKVRWDYHTKRWFRVAPNYKTKDIDHPTVKPLSVIKQMIENCTDEWWVVFDPYMWSWTTAVACKELNRNFIWCEINPKYCEIAEKRLSNTMHEQTLFNI